MAVIGWVDCGLRLSREPQEDRTMADKAMAYTTETGRGSSKLEQGDVAKAPGEVRGAWPSDHRRAFVEGVAWWEYTKTGGMLRESDRRMAEAEAARRYQDADPALVPEPERTCLWTHIPCIPFVKSEMWRADCRWEQPNFQIHPRGEYCPGCGRRVEERPAMLACGAALTEIEGQG